MRTFTDSLKELPILFVDSLKMLRNKLNGKCSHNKNVSLTLGPVYRNAFDATLMHTMHQKTTDFAEFAIELPVAVEYLSFLKVEGTRNKNVSLD